ncbi:MAG: septal ring lytic transglycosylase RlpA family protein [Deltaproteobacteria bacterium]|nr:septal ring lytic transglycosylase RlpA family protein [Deltaproteobacteria bacterium]
MKANEDRSARLVSHIMAITIANILASCATSSPVAPVPPPISTAAPISQAKPAQESSPAPRIQVVKASWYGHALAGHKTTSGEPYNPEGLTAASKTLPLGTVVKVSNPENGKSVKVRINDRGPFVRGRSMDLSHHAAKALGIVHKGITRVEVQKLTSPSAVSTDGTASPQPNIEEADNAGDKDKVEH